MPGLVLASRRWMIGSDDFIIPGSFLLLAHLIWIAIYASVCVRNGTIFLHQNCPSELTYHMLGQLLLIIACMFLEGCIIRVSFRGSILVTKPRSPLAYLIYIRFALFVIQVFWEIYGLVILLNSHVMANCAPYIKDIIVSLKIYDSLVWLMVVSVMWCSFDPAGRSWVKMKKFQDSLKDKNSKYKYRRSRNSQRNWRHREAIREYEKTWDNRCRKFCCIINLKSPRENSLAEIAKLLSEFFRDLDVVPSDVIAGLSLIRVKQKATRHDRVKQTEENVYQFISGAAITSETNFLDLTHPLVVQEVFNLIHYMQYSLAIYGWPMFIMANSPADWCKLLKHVQCANSPFCCCRCVTQSEPHLERSSNTVVEDYFLDSSQNDMGDNCCLCNRAAIKQTCIDHNYRIIYITYHVAVEKPAFFVAVDYDKMAIVITIRGTSSLYDVLTDLNAEHEILPMDPPNDEWFGHKGMVAAANYIRNKLSEKRILEIANEDLRAKESKTNSFQYPIIVVGHSLGAGTAAILAILLRQFYHNVVCFAFAPPGGLLSEAAAEHSKDFVISIVLGKDIVPRLGLHQMEKLRFDLISAIKQCEMSKWAIIAKSCCFGKKQLSTEEFAREFHMDLGNGDTSNVITTDEFKNLSIHPNDASISLTVHTPLYPPGSIIQLVRMHPKKSEKIIGKKKPITQAIWSDIRDFNEILISPTMITDHMPDAILEALKSLLTTTGPQKPQRSTDLNERQPSNTSSNDSESVPSKIIVETSFTDSYKTSGLGAYYDETRLRRLRSLVRKGHAPLATPETISLSSNTEPIVTVEKSTNG